MKAVSGNMSVMPMGVTGDRLYRVSRSNGVTVMYLSEHEMWDMCKCLQQLGLVKVEEQ